MATLALPAEGVLALPPEADLVLLGALLVPAAAVARERRVQPAALALFVVSPQERPAGLGLAGQRRAVPAVQCWIVSHWQDAVPVACC